MGGIIMYKEFNENDFTRRLTDKDVEKINKKRKDMKAHNKKYNNLRKKHHD
jgi:hypothetical protein